MDQILNVVQQMQDGASGVDFSAVFKNADLSPRVQRHLCRVYGTLALTLVTSVLGVCADLRFALGGALSTIGCILAVVALSIDRDPAHNQKRVSLLALFGFLQGCSLGPLIGLALRVDPAIVLTAFLGTATVFICFSLSALFSPRRSYLYLGGLISSACTFLAVLSLVSFFYRPVFMYTVHLYTGLAIFLAYILYDTQIIVERAESGRSDFVGDALQLFLDFVGTFVRLLVILLQNAQKKEQEKKRSANRR